MAKNTDFFSTLRAQGLRKRVAKALDELEKSGRSAGGRAEKAARQAIKDLRAAADSIEKRLDIGGAGSRSRAARKAATTRKRTATKRRPSTRKTTTKRTTATKRKAAPRRTAAKRSTSSTS
jgi:DNA-binding protein HU-beta